MFIDAHGQSDPGRCRDANEDSFIVAIDDGVFAVADGIGGLPAGEIASSLAMDNLVAVLSAQPDADEAMQLAAAELNRRIREAAAGNPAWAGMGTTLVAARLQDESLILGNVGDSRAYLARDGELRQLSEDHTVVAEQQKLGLESPDGTIGSHVITRALGVADEVEASSVQLDVQPGDTILLCSDGLTDMIPDDVIRSVLLATDSPQESCGMLIELANRNGGRDNITVVVVKFRDETLKNRLKNIFRARS